MRTKYLCKRVIVYENVAIAEFEAVQDGKDKANQQFNDFTPEGAHKIHIDKKAFFDHFKPGKSYYLDYTEAPTGEPVSVPEELIVEDPEPETEPEEEPVV